MVNHDKCKKIISISSISFRNNRYSDQSPQKFNGNSRNFVFFASLVSIFLLFIRFFLFEAQTISEYGLPFYLIVSRFSVTASFVITIRKQSDIFQVLEKVELKKVSVPKHKLYYFLPIDRIYSVIDFVLWKSIRISKYELNLGPWVRMIQHTLHVSITHTWKNQNNERLGSSNGSTKSIPTIP